MNSPRPLLVIALALAAGGSSLSGAAPATIEPGVIWKDDRGLPIQAHSASITRENGVYYWFGEDRTEGQPLLSRRISCYASTDLAHWTFRGDAADFSDPEHLGADWVLERPHVYSGAAGGPYVMYLHVDGRVKGDEGPFANYSLAHVGIAVADRIEGPYAYRGSFRPLGHESRDIGQFVDDDGTAYLIFEDRPNGVHIVRLTADHLAIEREVCLLPQHLEGFGLVKVGGTYYFAGSQLTGWAPNSNRYATARSLAGPWSEFRDIALPAAKTYRSQVSMLLKVRGTAGTTVLFVGDLWNPDRLCDSRYLWMPVEIGGGRLFLPAPHPWTIDAAAGVTTGR